MSCLLTSGYSLGCLDNMGGIKEVYIGEWNGDGLVYTFGTNSIITGFTGSTGSFYTFEQDLQVGSYTEEYQNNIDNGVSYYNQTLSIALTKLDSALRSKLIILGRGKWRIIVKDKNNRYWLMGKENPIRVSAMTPGFGKANTDMNGAMITFLGSEPEIICEVTEAAALTLIV